MTAPGVFYPRGADTAEERLGYYASRFPLVEVDATYYALPARRTARAVGRAHAAGLHVRHQGPRADDRPADRDEAAAEGPARGAPRGARREARIYAKDLPDELRDDVWARFVDGLEPLHEAGQLGSILLQYPRWFFTSSENRDAIEERRRAAARRRDDRAVEFRNATWFNEKNLERTIAFLGERRDPARHGRRAAGLQVERAADRRPATSPDLAVVRFHGRRTETWEAKGIPTVERFRYLYDEGELGEWVPRVREAAAQAQDTHVLFNNCYANYGATNALELAQLLLDLEAGR